MRIRTGILAAAAASAVLAVLAGCAPAGSSFAGTWGTSDAGKPSLTIESSDSFHGYDGCNQLTGKGRADGDTFRLGDFAITRKACLDTDDWLSRAYTVRVSGDDLVVYDRSGEKIGSLGRQ